MLDEDYSVAIVATITQPLLVLDEELRVEVANRAFLAHFQVDAAETEGRHIYELGNGQWDIPELRNLLDDVLDNSGRPVDDYRVEHEFEDLGRRIMLVTANRMRREVGPGRIVVAISDVTEREQLILELEGRKEFAEKLIDSVREALIVLGCDLKVHSANQSFYDTFEVSREETEGRLIYELGNGQWDLPELRQLLEDVLPKQQWFDDYEVDHAFEGIGRRIMLLNGRRLDHLNLILLAIRDVTEARAAEVRQRTLMAELQHRVKNILSNVSALAAITARRSRDLDQFQRSFGARLEALSRSQDLLVRAPPGSIDIRDIILLELVAVGAEEGAGFTLDGPAVDISSHAAQPLAMTFHELTTNAAKYGALSVDTGKIAIGWRCERWNGQPHVVLDWREHGVSIRDQVPETGFGTQMIRTSIPHALGGSVEFALEPDGAVCRIAFPIPQ